MDVLVDYRKDQEKGGEVHDHDECPGPDELGDAVRRVPCSCLRRLDPFGSVTVDQGPDGQTAEKEARGNQYGGVCGRFVGVVRSEVSEGRQAREREGLEPDGGAKGERPGPGQAMGGPGQDEELGSSR